ncbi:LacI family DNA-binding transcriptional regulator [Kineosporia sp. NBRC 101731]|uniref:LacI family DNA-binding transcriptional regulator n=1 Tax=Kineosporia sp. NBRC 101731 TaxID=3032199 RepID=UPI0024A2F13C|nr:LacI family DNA-binding transcriptional regulator [Kineosporia sp. NBRC 101731]GLY28994.1 LacI family transcriptional regulator [Kineosporia sp. NBRC 101731]
MAARRRPTVHDVAKLAGVSIATVSFSFRRPDQVRPETRQTVLAAAKEIGYIPSASARGLVRGKTGALGLHSYEFLLERPLHEVATSGASPARPLDLDRSVIPWSDIADGQRADIRAYPLYVDEVQRGFELEARRHGRPVLVGRGDPSSGALTETAGRVDGLAIFPGLSAAASLQEVTLNMPVVLFSLPSTDDQYHHVLVDNQGGMGDLVTHLVREHGVQDLEFVGGTMAHDYLERFLGFQHTLRQLGVRAPQKICDDADLGRGPAFTGVLQRLRSGSLPQALVCASDQLAVELLDLLRREGVSVPGDVIVTGFDGILAGLLSHPPLTTVRQPMEAMGRVAAQLLMLEAEDDVVTGRTVQLGTSLETRASCGC